MAKSPWGTIGAWAEESERAEAEEREAAAVQPPTSFPSLKESVTTSKQKKKTKMSLQQFTMQQSTTGSAPSRGLTTEEMFRLPTGPKERSPDEMQHGKLGGGFNNYGTRPRSNQDRGRDYDGRRSFGFDDENRRGQARVSEPIQPSRADEIDNWASMKKHQERTLPDRISGHAESRYSSLGGGGSPGFASRADEVDNWASAKKPILQQQQPETRSSRFGSGFSRPETDRWTRNESQRLVLEAPKSEIGEAVVKVNKPNPFGAARPREEVLLEKGLDWKKLDLEIEGKKQHPVSGGLMSRPTSSQSSRAETPHSIRSELPVALTPGVSEEGTPKQKPKVNPFGNAKPREVLLEEKGLDWKKIDLELEHRRVERPETEEEKHLKDEIEHLKKELLQKSGDEPTSIQDLLHKREHELELLVRQLDDKVRYTQGIFERPGSGSGRGAERPPSRPGTNEGPRHGFNDRPPSRPGSHDGPRAGFYDQPPSGPRAYDEPRAGYTERPRSRPGAYEDPRQNFYEQPRPRPGAYDEPRGGFSQRASFPQGAFQEPRAFDYNERSQSHGTSNSWTRPSDDRKDIQDGGGKGFFGRRDMDRSGSRW